MTWESPLYGDITLEVTDDFTGDPITWVNVSADLTYVTASRGGRATFAGQSETQVGMMTASLSDTAATVGVGYWVRLSNAGGVLWGGYVQDIDTVVLFSDSVNNRKTVVTRLICADWVGRAGQIAVPYGAGMEDTGALWEQNTDGYYPAADRLAYLNMKTLGDFPVGSIGTLPIFISGSLSSTIVLSDCLVSGSLADHLDLLTMTAGGYWNSLRNFPAAVGDNVSYIAVGDTPASTGLTFTDGVTGLHYTNLEITDSSSNVANVITVDNVGLSGAIEVGDYEIVDNGVASFTDEWTATDDTSRGLYGERRSTVQTNVGYKPTWFASSTIPIRNRVANPQLNDEVTGWTTLTANAQGVRTKPSVQVTPFANYANAGLYAFRTRVSTAVPSVSMGYAYKGEDLEVTAGLRYRFDMAFSRGDLSSTLTQSQLQIVWKDANQATLSTSSSGNVDLNPALRTWATGGLLATAPANAKFAELRWLFKRSDGANLALGSHYWATAAMFYQIPAAGTPGTSYFTGSSPATAFALYKWLGEPHASDSAIYLNALDGRSAQILAANSTTEAQVRSLRWNAQENLAAVDDLDVNKTITIVYDGVSATYRIVGITHEIEPERYIIELQVKKV